MTARLPSTPYAVVDVAVLDRNITRVADWARSADVALRPHVKTHKVPEIARRQLAAGAVGITVATVGEAEVFAAAGCEDVFIAYPLWLDDARGARLVALPARVTVGVDSPEAATRLARHRPGAAALVEVDSGHHRSGVLPGLAGRVAKAAADAGLDVRGVFTFPGHAYSPGDRHRAAAEEAAALRAAGAALTAVGLEAPVLSGGSTPSLEATDSSVVTEARPGVYALGDAQQWELGAARPEDLAYTVHATCVSHAGGRAVLDSGSKVLGADRPPWTTGWGRLLDHPDARIVQLSEHHAVVDLAGAPLPRLGDVVRVLPNHVCNSVNLLDELHADDDGLLEVWPVAARGRNA